MANSIGHLIDGILVDIIRKETSHGRHQAS